jgi:TPP-dependent pyruvate/acetoin dehydrogenase alpha subunit
VMPKRAHSAHDIVSLAATMLPAKSVDGTDALATWSAAGDALAAIRGGGGPRLLHCRTKRWMKHQGHERCDLADNAVDVARDCPIHKLEAFLRGSGLAGGAELTTLAREIDGEIEDAITFAQASPFPTVDLLEA